MPLNNYLDCIPTGNHDIQIGVSQYRVLFDQYNPLGFNWANVHQKIAPHYYQQESTVIDLKNILKSSLKEVFSDFLFETSGSMALEHAIQYSQICTNKKKPLKYFGCYHGSSNLLRNLEHEVPLSLPCSNDNHIINVSTLSYDESLQEIETRISTDQICCILIDPNFCDYYITPPDNYYIRLRELCDRYNVLIIFDEMRTGFRSEKIWAANNLPIEVDIVVGAKALCNGLPFSLVALNKRISQKPFLQKVDEACTGFSYNPFVLEIVKAISKDLEFFLCADGKNTISCLHDFSKNNAKNKFYDIIVKGNYLILEFKTNRAVFAATFCENQLKQQNMLVYRSENRVIICPHYTIPLNELHNALNTLIESAHIALSKLKLQ